MTTTRGFEQLHCFPNQKFPGALYLLPLILRSLVDSTLVSRDTYHLPYIAVFVCGTSLASLQLHSIRHTLLQLTLWLSVPTQSSYRAMRFVLGILHGLFLRNRNLSRDSLWSLAGWRACCLGFTRSSLCCLVNTRATLCHSCECRYRRANCYRR